MNVLIIRLSAMGDVAMTVPVVASLAKQYPDLSITVMSGDRFADMFYGIDGLDFFGVDTKVKYKGFWGIFKLFRALRKHKKFDLVLDMHDVLRSKVLRMLFTLGGVRCVCIDKGREEKKQLVSGNIEKTQLKTSIERYCDTVKNAGFDIKIDFNSIFSETAALPEAMFSLSDFMRNNGIVIAVAPFAQHQGKIYPVEKMREVVRLLSKKENVKVLLFGGGKNEIEILEAWASEFDNVTSVAGKYSLIDELRIISRVNCLISMDSANMHLASLVGTRVVSVWGATHPYAGFYGYGQSEADAVQLEMKCRPCSIYGNKPCRLGGYPCMSNISPESIVERVFLSM